MSFVLDSVEAMVRAVELEHTHRSLDIGYVDASVIATCEFLDEDKVVTLDRRHFSVVRPAHRPVLRFLPD